MLRQNIEVTQDKKLVNPAIHAVQGDTGRTVVALVKDATISGTATMAFERPDGATYTTTATVNSDNSVEATFTADMLRVAGTGKATFKVVSSGSQVSTYQLYVLVEPSAGFERPVTPSSNKIYVYVNGSPVEVATAAEVVSKASQSQVDGISATVNNLVGRIVEDESNIAINTTTLSNITPKVTKNESDISELKDDLTEIGIKRNYTENELNWTDGYYINYSDGSAVGGQSNYSVTDFVKLDRKDLNYLTVVTSLTVSSRGMAFYDSSKTYITGHQNLGGSYGAMVEHTYEIPTNAEYVRFTCIKEYKNETKLSTTGKIFEKLDVFSSLYLNDFAKYDIEWIDGTYINYSNGSQTNGASYSSTKHIPVLNSKRIYIKAFLDSVGASGLAFYDSTQSYIRGIQITGYPFEEILDVPQNAYYVRFSTYTQDKDKSTLCLSKNTELMPFYSKVLCIGDSLTQGAYYINGGTGDSVRKGYPAYLGRIMNTPVDNAGYSGINARDWYNNRKLSSYSKYDAVIIWLGTNQGLTDTIETDCVGSDYTQYADTYTGCYCKIIESILASSPNCNIYLVNVFASSGNVEVTQNVIRKIGVKYNLPVFDMSDWDAHTKPYLHGNINNIHFSVYGNMAIAKHFYEMISNDMVINYLKADKRPNEYIEYWNNTSRPS